MISGRFVFGGYSCNFSNDLQVFEMVDSRDATVTAVGGTCGRFSSEQTS
jgi:hypothetical protein